MPSDESEKESCTGNNPGTWLATPASQEAPATQTLPPAPVTHNNNWLPFRAAGIQVTRSRIIDDPFFPEFPEKEDYQPEEQAIEDEFRRRLFGLRRLSRAERPHALKVARDLRQMALNALRQRRELDRSEILLRRQLRMPEPT